MKLPYRAVAVGVALRPPPVADKGSIALSEITSKRMHIYVQRIATIFQTGGHWTPALMKLTVLCVCYDVMKVMYRQSFWFKTKTNTRIIFVI